jgi:NTP pyrophosphatase (non-canonical NTP hydrolase)
MDFAELQDVIDRTYGERDRERGTAPTVAWLCEEVGELAQAVRKGSREQQLHEFGDVVAWVATLANQVGIDLDEAVARYAEGCPKCDAVPCTCIEPAR